MIKQRISVSYLILKNSRWAGAALSALLALGAAQAPAAVNPYLPFYGSGGTITVDPAYPIVARTPKSASWWATRATSRPRTSG